MGDDLGHMDAVIEEDALLILRNADIVRGASISESIKPLVVKFKRVRDGVKIPEYKTAGAAGMDICSALDYQLYRGERKVVLTGIAVELPPGFELQIRPRSGLAALCGITVLNAPGTIDEDYRGEIGVVLVNHGGYEPFMIKAGDRIAQLVLAPVWKLPIEVVEELSETKRGAGGFGSTGV